jgi:hypothetical protein
MSLLDVGWLYLLVGLACAVAVVRRTGVRPSQAAGSAVLTTLLWPLWAPIALTGATPTRRGSARERSAPQTESVQVAVRRIESALREGVDTAEGSALAALLPASAAERILAEVARVAARHAELEQLLRTPDLDLARADARLTALEASDGAARAIATARLHAENVRRLARLRDRDARALDELADLTAALRTQLVLARFAGSSVDGASGIVGEVWARVEGLSEAMDATETPEQDP